MRAAFSILGLVIVLAIVMVNLRNSARQLAAPAASAPTGSGASDAAASPKTQTEAVRTQVQDLVDQAAAQRASELAAP